MRVILFVFVLFPLIFLIQTSFAAEPDAEKKYGIEKEITLDQNEEPVEKAPIVKKPVRSIASVKKKKNKANKASKRDFEDTQAAEELEDTVIPSLEDSIGDTKDLKAQLLQELEDEHQVGSKDQGLKTYFEAKSPEGKKKFDFKDVELQVIGRHTEKISGKKFRRDISSDDNSADKKKILKRKKEIIK